ncbi:pantetheine-phosphate adenylyltransferase [Chloroflexota bacterium]
MTIAFYPGSFDPITNGHLDIATRAARLFDKLVIGVYDTPAKNLLFNTEERADLVKQAVTGLPNIEVRTFSGLTVDYAKEIGAQTLVRGLRAITDFEHEFDMALMNKKLNPECELVLLTTSLQYAFLSSSRIKEVASLGGNIDDLVPKPVSDALKQKVISQV